MLSLSLPACDAVSASYENPGRFVNQAVNLAVALAAMWLIAQLAPQTMMRFAVPAYIIASVSSSPWRCSATSSRRAAWLHVGVTRFQPSEMMKLALPLMLACTSTARNRR